MTDYFHDTVLPELSERVMLYFYQALDETLQLAKSENIDEIDIFFQKEEFGKHHTSMQCHMTLYVDGLTNIEAQEKLESIVDFLDSIETLIVRCVKNEFIYDNDIFSHDKVDYQFPINTHENTLDILKKFLQDRYFSFLEKTLLELKNNQQLDTKEFKKVKL